MDAVEAVKAVARMDIERIMEMIPHRHPFLMIDKVIDVVANEQATGIKNVSINEPYFQGHFPARPVMPGVLIIEAMAQACAILTFHSEQHRADERLVYYLVGVDDARFKKPVMPGDALRLEVALDRHVRAIWKFTAQALVGDVLVAESGIMCTVRTLKEDAQAGRAPHA